jgi:hypothetical protein
VLCPQRRVAHNWLPFGCDLKLIEHPAKNRLSSSHDVCLKNGTWTCLTSCLLSLTVNLSRKITTKRSKRMCKNRKTTCHANYASPKQAVSTYRPRNSIGWTSELSTIYYVYFIRNLWNLVFERHYISYAKCTLHELWATARG